MKTLKAIMIGAGLRGNAYSAYALHCPGDFQIVGVAEPDDLRREEYRKCYNIADENCLKSWHDVFSREKWADIVMICTQDVMHYEPIMAAINQGYDILLEKPIAPTARECAEIAEAAKKKGTKIVVCHVLRYTPFFKTLKEIIDSGEIGDIVTMVHNENVGNTHHAHSFVRGNWGVTEKSAPMILAKSCHDMDIMQWLIGKSCLRLSSFGTLKYFKKENCPKDAPPRCTDGCKVENCPYDTRYLYFEGDLGWCRAAATGQAEPTDAEVEDALKTGPYGRCVFQCDNDVVDHQVVSMEFEDGITAIFSMSSFTPDISRTLKIMGTKGQIKGNQENGSIIVSDFITRKSREITIVAEGDHGGGDAAIMPALCNFVRGYNTPAGITEISISAANHMLCFAAEKSRLNGGKPVDIKDFTYGWGKK